MTIRITRGSGYHAWPASTPLLDAARQIAGAGSVVVGAYALVFALLALRDGAIGQLLDYGLVVAALVAANVALAALRHRRRHYG